MSLLQFHDQPDCDMQRCGYSAAISAPVHSIPAALHSGFIASDHRSMPTGSEHGPHSPKNSWEFFVKRMKSPEAISVKAKIASLLHKITNDAILDGQACRMIASFLDGPILDFSNPLWTGATDDEMRQARDGLQKFILNKLYKQLFESTPSARLRDSALSDHIQRLWWIEPSHLDIPSKYSAHPKLQSARTELQKIDLFKPPQDKLVCILNCCQIISNVITHANKDSDCIPPAADDFLPLLILVTLHSRLTNPFLNLQYISTFCHPDDLMGSNGYMFTHFFSAITFIENINASILVNCDENEFERMCYGVQSFDGEISMNYADISLADLRISDLPVLFHEYKAMAKQLRSSNRMERKSKASLLKPVFSLMKGSSENKV